VIDGYTERHHVLPRCLGGGDDASNIVRLTPEEHYVAHQLLVKMHPGNSGLLGAAAFMSSRSSFLGRRNKTYGWLRRRVSEHMAKRTVSKESIEKGAAKNRLKKRSKEFKENVGRFHTGKKRPPETCVKISIAAKKRFENPTVREAVRAARIGCRHSDEAKARMRAAALGRKMSAETRLKMSLASKGKKKSPEAIANMRTAQLKRSAPAPGG